MGYREGRERKRGQCPKSKEILEAGWLCLVWVCDWCGSAPWADGEQLGRTLLAWLALGLKSC